MPPLFAKGLTSSPVHAGTRRTSAAVGWRGGQSHSLGEELGTQAWQIAGSPVPEEELHVVARSCTCCRPPPISAELAGGCTALARSSRQAGVGGVDVELGGRLSREGG
jgi:hypothetical protein